MKIEYIQNDFALKKKKLEKYLDRANLDMEIFQFKCEYLSKSAPAGEFIRDI